MERFKTKKIIGYIILVILIPALVVLSNRLFKDRSFYFAITIFTVLTIGAFALSFEGKEHSVEKLIMMASMIALSVVGRMAFVYIPHFKPLGAMAVITGIYLGPQAGFLCGALTMLISNFAFGQGSWTVYQMLGFGAVGLIAGILSKWIRGKVVFTCIVGALSGILYSAIMDISTTLFIDGSFNLLRYLGFMASSLPTTITYIVSNVVFLALLSYPLGKIIERIKIKYGI